MRLGVLSLASIAQCVACLPTPTPSQQADVATYEAEQTACIAAYSTRKEIDVCRDMVKARHGRLDAGVE